ncbi:hypothetical protein GCM10011492_35730 [Flexivirga endophytica]|uniref:Uncharacterized protein n=1 Tax=Flexivirga endophytica TaxID=1849103 RepID=A0A916TFZ3_9MICO|nr:hypothetical protein [Flexivirga endophytica]GGB41640.1 hypothetical protein GCM10011492_35730 [Flexivirga endophytica]GHB49485.1 hypothetical protein GCM10008112_18110 [Flexivirga endophytica]
MAKIITTSCEWCGDIELAAGTAQLDIPVRARNDPTMRFTCPRCNRTGSQRVPERVVMLLLRAGVQVAVGPEQGSDSLHRHG